MSALEGRPPLRHGTSSDCPHCGRPFGEAGKTAVRCGSCDARTRLLGSRATVAHRVFECPECGAINHVPEPGASEEVDDGPV